MGVSFHPPLIPPVNGGREFLTPSPLTGRAEVGDLTPVFSSGRLPSCFPFAKADLMDVPHKNEHDICQAGTPGPLE